MRSFRKFLKRKFQISFTEDENNNKEYFVVFYKRNINYVKIYSKSAMTTISWQIIHYSTECLQKICTTKNIVLNSTQKHIKLNN